MQLYHIPYSHFENEWPMADWLRLIAVMQEGDGGGMRRRGIRLSEYLGLGS